MINKCLFPAAGYGSRFLPATKATPKEMLPIVSNLFIQYGVEEALEGQNRYNGNSYRNEEKEPLKTILIFRMS